MRSSTVTFALILTVGTLSGAEHTFDFGVTDAGKLPKDMAVFVAGEGGPADWQVVLDEAPTELAPISPLAKTINRRAVLAQTSKVKVDERFPVAYFPAARYGDFTFRTRLKLVDGAGEQIAGVVFRLQDEKNFYVARANALDGNVRFYKFVNGERTAPVGNDLKVTKGDWHELEIECTGNRIQVRLNGKEAMPPLNDNSFATGRLGFITKSDAVSYFADAKVTYRPLVTLAETILNATLEGQPRLLNLRIFGKRRSENGMVLLAAKNAAEVGNPATDLEMKVVGENQIYVGKTRKEVLVTAPLRDRNGEAIGVAQFSLKPFAGQTEANATARVEVMLKDMQRRVGSADSLADD
jgi:hypothetical protein